MRIVSRVKDRLILIIREVKRALARDHWPSPPRGFSIVVKHNRDASGSNLRPQELVQRFFGSVLEWMDLTIREVARSSGRGYWPSPPETFSIIVKSGRVVAATNLRPQDLLGRSYNSVLEWIKSNNGEIYPISLVGPHTCADWPNLNDCAACNCHTGDYVGYRVRVRRAKE